MPALMEEIEKLKKQLAELIEHGHAFSDEIVIQTSQKLDELINCYLLLQRKRQTGVISYRYIQKSAISAKGRSAVIIRLQ